MMSGKPNCAKSSTSTRSVEDRILYHLPTATPLHHSRFTRISGNLNKFIVKYESILLEIQF